MKVCFSRRDTSSILLEGVDMADRYLFVVIYILFALANASTRSLFWEANACSQKYDVILLLAFGERIDAFAVNVRTRRYVRT